MLCGACTKTVTETVYEYLPAEDSTVYSIQSFGVLPANSAALNKTNLQKAIDWASDRGAALYVEPVQGGYPVDGGLVLRKNVSLTGVHGPTGRGTSDSEGNATGSLFRITDKKEPFITVESATQIRGIQFYYPEQGMKASAIKEYPPTIKVSQTSAVNGVTLSCLTFYGATFAMDFRASSGKPCEQILFEHCYGYPLGGQFIAIDYCYDIPRILHCHVNPAVMREFRGDYPKEVNDAVIARRTYAYSIDHTDNAQVMDIFTFATYGGIMLGAATYGQMTNFNFDCVCNGIFKDGDSDFNRVWEVAQGSIIANCSPSGNLSEIHPLLMQGKGHLSLTNVDAFSGDNGVVTNLAQSYDFMTVRGSNVVCVTGVNCRMRNYSADEPVTVSDYSARISFLNCTDKNNNIFNWTYGI